jgi:hypothetical protein
MSEGTYTFAFKADDHVQFKDGRNTRRAVVISQEPAADDLPNGYVVMFKIKETGQIRLARWAASDLQAAEAQSFAFKLKDVVTVVGADGERGQTGTVFDRAPMSKDNLDPSYAVLFKDENGRTDLAWWSESILTTVAVA